MNKNRILAAFVTYKMLYNDKNTDVYDIISEFIRYIIVTEHKLSFLQTELSTLISEYYDFQIPSLVIKPAVKRIVGVTLQKKEYYIDYTKIESHPDFKTLQNEAINNNDTIINDLIKYIQTKSNQSLTDQDENIIIDSFRRYILDESTNGTYDKLISAFIIEKSSNPDYVSKINRIREGHILYSGLSFNQNISSYGWNGKLILYFDVEILFHLAGYNGTTFQRIAEEFLDLISDANEKEQFITLRYFKETKNRIDRFFDTAEQIFSENKIVRPDKPAMESILSDCKASIEITNKKNKFYYLLNTKKIYEEKKSDFYSPRYRYANLESEEYTDQDDQYYICLISHINKLRANEVAVDYTDAKALLISETGDLLEFSRKFTKEKEIDYAQISGKDEHIIPFAVNLYTITNVLWYRLNNSFHRKNEPSTTNAVIRAQIVLSKYINDSITEQYDTLLSQQEKDSFDKEQLASMIVGMRRRSRKPEQIVIEGVDDALNFICEKDINKYKEDYEIEINAHNQLKKNYEDALQKITATQKTMASFKRQAEYDRLEFEYKEAKSKLDNLSEWLQHSKTDFEKQKELLRRSSGRRKIAISSLYILFSVILLLCIGIFSWNTMEPIIYIVGIPSTIYLFVSKVFKVEWGVDNFIYSYKKSPDYINAQATVDTYKQKVDAQQNIVNSKYTELSKYYDTLDNDVV